MLKYQIATLVSGPPDKQQLLIVFSRCNIRGDALYALLCDIECLLLCYVLVMVLDAALPGFFSDYPPLKQGYPLPESPLTSKHSKSPESSRNPPRFTLSTRKL